MVKIFVQQTPNPNARKFILDRDVLLSGKASFKQADPTDTCPLVQALFELGGIEEVHLFENVITVTKTDEHPWQVMEQALKTTIEERFEQHDPSMKLEQHSSKPKELSPELAEIDAILERTIRPGLRMDGGDLTLIALKGNLLTIQYEGACGSCPSSQMGTLMAIQDILRNEYNPDIEVMTV